jgi:hypothetical protein
MLLEDFFFSDFPQSLSAKLYGWADKFLRLPIDGFPFYGLSTDASWKQAPFYAHGIAAVCNVADFFGPSAPYNIAAVERSIFGTFEGLAFWRTRFNLRQ